MNDKTPNQVSAECAKLYQNGVTSLERNEVDSAIASFTTALDIEPGFVACREALRDAQRKSSAKPNGFWKRMVTKGRLSPALAEAEALLHLKPLKTISIAERVLNQDPGNTSAHRLLAKAALAAELPRTAVLSLESLAADDPEQSAIKRDLADALAKSGDPSAAATIYGQLLKDNPNDRTVLRALKNIAAQPAMLLPAPETSVAPIPPPAEDPAALGGLSDDEIIKRFEPMMAHCSRNTKVMITLAQAYARKNMFDKSMPAFERALAVAGGKNAAIETAIADTMLKKLYWELSRSSPTARNTRRCANESKTGASNANGTKCRARTDP